jgi:hypothetical protein
MGQKLVRFGQLGQRDLIKTSRKRCMKWGRNGRLRGAMGGMGHVVWWIGLIFRLLTCPGAAGKKSTGLLSVHQTPHHHPRAWSRRYAPRGSSASQPPVVFRPCPLPPVGGWGRLGASSWPQIRRWDRRRCPMQISGGPLGGPEVRWVLSVGWCPSKRVVVIHCARPYTALGGVISYHNACPAGA